MKEKINGRPVPYDLPEGALVDLLSSPDMMDFTVACEALSYRGTLPSCQRIGAYLCSKDKYRRLYALKVIFRNPHAGKYVPELERAIASGELLFADNGLAIAARYQVDVSGTVVLAAVSKHLNRLSHSALYALGLLTPNQDNFARITDLLLRAEGSIRQEVLAEILIERYYPNQGQKLFRLFSDSDNAKLRTLAVRIEKQNEYDVSSFENDPDGHVRKAVGVHYICEVANRENL